MLAFDNMQGNHNIYSQLNFHSIQKQSDFTFSNIKFHQQHNEPENQFGFSPRLWSKNPCSSSSSSNKTMADARKELMEKINDLPDESCFELSLKDMVAEDQDGLGFVTEDHKVGMKPKMKQKRKGTKRGSISRSMSLDTGVFFLKMFVPSSFGSKKPKVYRSSSIGGSKKHDVDVKQWKTDQFLVGKKDNTSSSRRYCGEEDMKSGNWFKSTTQKFCIFF